jgi:hypothetical protein
MKINFNDGLDIEQIEVEGNRIKNTVKVFLGENYVEGKLAVTMLTKEEFRNKKINLLKVNSLKDNDFSLRETAATADFISSSDIQKVLMGSITAIGIEGNSSATEIKKDKEAERIKAIEKLSEDNAIILMLVEKYVEVVMEYNGFSNKGKQENTEKEKKEETSSSDK